MLPPIKRLDKTDINLQQAEMKGENVKEKKKSGNGKPCGNGKNGNRCYVEDSLMGSMTVLMVQMKKDVQVSRSISINPIYQVISMPVLQ